MEPLSDQAIGSALNGANGSEKDRAIVAALKGTNAKLQSRAVKELLTCLRPMLRAYTYKNSGTSKDGDDLANTVVGILYENIQQHKYEQREGVKLSTYCWDVGRKIWLKAIRDDNDISLEDDNPGRGAGYTPSSGEDPSGPFDDVEDGSITSPAMQKAWRAFKKLGPACQRMVRLELDGVIDEEVLLEYPGTTAEQLKARRFECKREWLRLIKKEPPLVVGEEKNGACLERAYAGLTPGQFKLLEMDREGLTEIRIQEAFGYKTLGAVKVNRSRAKRRLNELYEQCMNGQHDEPIDGPAR